ncbi:MAG: dynamin family protein [Kineosporiaceae bacterium]
MDTQADAARGPATSGTLGDVQAALSANGAGAPAGAPADAVEPPPVGLDEPQSVAVVPERPAPVDKTSAEKTPAGPTPVGPAPAHHPAAEATHEPATGDGASVDDASAANGSGPSDRGGLTAAEIAALAEDDADEPGLLESAENLREEVSALQLPLVVGDVVRARVDRERLLAQLDDYLLPRLRRMDAPLLAVIGGSTGAGKSTLTNSLVRKEVSRSGVLRPTTRSPVLVHHPYDSGAFLSQRILPNLARVTAEAPEPLQPIDVDAPRITALRLVPHEGVPAGIAVIDAPDIDSVVDTNRELAVQLLAAADLWLFVTTAARYSDAVPWDMLRNAVERGASVAVVLDRVPREDVKEIRIHLATMLRDRGLASSPMFTIPETRTVGGLLPPEVVAPLLGWLRRLARDARSRDVIVRRTLAGALDSLRDRVQVVADAADDQRAVDAALRAELADTFEQAGVDVHRRLSDGTVLRGEVLARWQGFVGTGEFVRSLEANMGRLRDRLTALRGRTPPAEPLDEALQTGVQAIVRASAQRSVEQAVLRWRRVPAGAALVGDATTAGRAPDFDARLARTVRDWQTGVLDIVRDESQGRRTTARALSLGVDGIAVILMLAACSQTLDASDPDSGAAAGTAALAQRILDAVFGDQAVRSLTTKVHSDLVARVEGLLGSERARVLGMLDAVGVLPGAGDRLRNAVAAVEGAR